MIKPIHSLILAALLSPCFSAFAENAPSISSTATTSIPFGNYQGAWVGRTAYAAGAVVTYEGETYFAVASNTNVPPENHPFKWAQLPSLPTVALEYVPSAISNLGSAPGTLIASAPVPIGGTYAFSASAMVYVDAADLGVFCYTIPTGGSTDGVTGGLYNPGNDSQEASASITDYWDVSSGNAAQLWCYSESNDADSEVESAGLLATLVTGELFGPVTGNNRPQVKPRTHTKQHQQ